MAEDLILFQMVLVPASWSDHSKVPHIEWLMQQRFFFCLKVLPQSLKTLRVSSKFGEG
jgi:hypothetical protein